MEKNNITASHYLNVQVLRATENSPSYHACGIQVESISILVPLGTSMAGHVSWQSSGSNPASISYSSEFKAARVWR